MSILLGILTFVLIIVSVFLVLLVLMQKSKDSGMGAALGGGAAEAAFGADTTNVLFNATRWMAVTFFVLAFALYLGRIYEHKHAKAAAGSALPTMPAAAAPAAPAPAATTAATPTVTLPAAPTPADVNAAAAATAPAATPAAAPAATPAPEAPKK